MNNQKQIIKKDAIDVVKKRVCLIVFFIFIFKKFHKTLLIFRK